MATLSEPSPPKAKIDYPAHTQQLDTIMGILTFILVSGLFIDGWAHNHGRVDDSFFTPYHLVMYSSYALFGIVLLGLHRKNINRGYTFMKAFPQGYMVSLVGVFIFGAGGLADLFWHTAFGIEEGIEALYSPSHLILGIGYSVVIAGVIQSAWVRHEAMKGWRDLWWVMLATSCLISIFTFFTQFMTFVSEFNEMLRRPFYADVLTTSVIASYIVSTALMIGMVLFIMRRWRLPLGAVSAIFALNATFMGLMLLLEVRNFDLVQFLLLMSLMVVPALLAGIVADVLIWRLKATPDTPSRIRVIATLTSFVLAGAYILAIQILGITQNSSLWWEIHTWLGIPTLCAITGFLLSFLIFPPTIPKIDEASESS